MAEQDLLQNSISRLGQSQDDRLPRELTGEFVPIDERDERALLAQAAALAEKLRYYADSPDAPAGTWKPFFDLPRVAPALDRPAGAVPPHLGLLLAFLRLYRHPQRAINTVAARHLDFQFRTVLGFEPRPAQPDRVHLLLELKKGAPATEITPDQAFSAGPGPGGADLLYRPVRGVVVTRGTVAALMSVFRDNGRLRFAPVANSADGLGAGLVKADPSWPPFGHAQLPPAPVGFALASPVLRMQEGGRAIRAGLRVPGLDPARHADLFDGAFEARLTGPAGWLGPFAVTAVVQAGRVELNVALPAGEPAVVDYAAAVHGHRFATGEPVLQFLLKPDAPRAFADFEGLAVGAVKVAVRVAGLRSLALESDLGPLNPKKAFQPFGPQPVVGSRFLVGSAEALAKRLTGLTVRLEWQGAPADLAAHYADYDTPAMNDGVSATLTFQDRTGSARTNTLTLMPRRPGPTSELSPDSSPPEVHPGRFLSPVYALLSSGSRAGRLLGARLQLERPIFAIPRVAPPAPRQGFVTVALAEDFLHTAYRRKLLENALKPPGEARKVLNEPYTPTVRAIELDYEAESDAIDVSRADEQEFANLDVQYFHVDCFGQSREHALLRRQAGAGDEHVTLLPQHPDEGEFLIGVSGVAAGDSLSLLVQVAEDTADPDEPPQEVRWSALADNAWRPLAAGERALDTTNHLRTSGIVELALPAETTTDHTRLPPGLAWVRATVRAHSRAACRLVRVANNAVEAVFVGSAADRRPAAALPENTISKLKDKLAAVKSVDQPFPSFGGRPRESAETATRRAAERLRHRDRCVDPWDYERLLLEAFPQVRTVKCVPHASDTSWYAPGHVRVVVVPDLRNRHAVDSLAPRVDVDTLDRMTRFAQDRAGPGTRVAVRNPTYRPVRVDFRVRFRPGEPFLFRRRQLQDALVRVLSPWARDAGAPIEFGGHVYRSVLLDFVEEQPFVDFVTDFKLSVETGAATSGPDSPGVRAERPDEVLASAAEHGIREVVDG
jgi:hypothetical protein